jgi:hypothetical protein
MVIEGRPYILRDSKKSVNIKWKWWLKINFLDIIFISILRLLENNYWELLKL